MTEIINGYTLITDFTTAGGGQCQWAFARRGDKEYFLKQFLKPKYPLPGSPGSPAGKAKKLKACEQFAARHKLIMDTLHGLSGSGGNLVVASDFFLWKASYYKVTERVKTGLGGLDAVSRFSALDKITLMLAVAKSLEILHRNNLVHGDIKPDNILVGHGDTGPNAKLIDFDDCFVQGEAPPKDEVVGDMRYYSPEMVDVLLDDAPTRNLTTKVDIFALGLTFVEYLTGRLPSFSDERTAAQALRAGGTMHIASRPESDRLVSVLQAMVDIDPTKRLDCRGVQDGLTAARRELKTGVVGTSIGPTPSPATTPTGPARPGGKLLDKLRAAATGLAPDPTDGVRVPTADPRPAAPAKPGGKLLDKLRAAEAAPTATTEPAVSPGGPTTADPRTAAPAKAGGKLLDKLRAAEATGASGASAADPSEPPAAARGKLLDRMRTAERTDGSTSAAEPPSPPSSATGKGPMTERGSDSPEEWPDSLD